VIAIVVYVLATKGDQIIWETITFNRFSIGGGGSITSVGGVFLSVIYGIFVINALPSYRKMKTFSIRMLELVTITLALLMIILSFTRAAMVALLISLFVYLNTLNQKKWVISYLFLMIPTVIFILLYFDTLAYLFTRQGVLAGDVDAGRFEMWQYSISVITESLESLVFGVETSKTIAAHNMLLGIWMEHGLFALIMYIIFHIMALLLVWKFAKNSDPMIYGNLGYRVFSVLSGLLVFASLVNTFYLNISLVAFLYYYLIGMIIILRLPGVQETLARLVKQDNGGHHFIKSTEQRYSKYSY
jgi:O-antigen ligase